MKMHELLREALIKVRKQELNKGVRIRMDVWWKRTRSWRMLHVPRRSNVCRKAREERTPSGARHL